MRLGIFLWALLGCMLLGWYGFALIAAVCAVIFVGGHIRNLYFDRKWKKEREEKSQRLTKAQ